MQQSAFKNLAKTQNTIAQWAKIAGKINFKNQPNT